jgi:Ca-activated chloride channel homolog
MTSAIPIMTEEEVRRCKPSGEEAGFGSLATGKGHLPLKAMDVEASIVGLAANIRLTQTFQNVFAEPLEATYIFPLPDRAGVTRFVMEVNGRIVEGEIKERSQARRAYTEAIEAGHRAAITEEERPGVFTMRVGNLMPNEVATIRLEMTGPLPYDEGEATFRFPLVVAPRYIPGRPLEDENVGDGVAHDTDAVPDASRITPPVLLPGYPTPVRLSLAIDLDGGGAPVSDVRSSLFAIEDKSPRGDRRRFEIQAGERANRDFVLRFKLGDRDTVRTSLVLSPDPGEGGPGAEGTFLLTLVPPFESPASDKPRDVIFVLDRSGSMDGWKMVAARRAVSRMVDTLRDRDRFNVYAFDDSIESPAEFSGTDLVAATNRNRFRAVEFLAKIESRGGTEMLQPLYAAADKLAGGYDDRERVLVLVTDGQVGNEDQIIREVSRRQKNLRVFALGIDRAVNEALLNRLAAIGGGMSEIVESEDRLDEVMDKMHRRIGTPLVTELRVLPTGLEVEKESIVPSRMPDLFAGAPVVITGRYRGAAQGNLTLDGKDAAGRGWSQSIDADVRPNRAIRTIWARGLVRELEDRFACGKGDRADLERRIVDTSLRFKVLSRFTAYLAVDKSERVNPSGQMHPMVQPVEAPEGWAMLEKQKRSFVTAAGMVPRGATAAAAAPARAVAQDMKSRAQAVPKATSASFEAPEPPPPAEELSAIADDFVMLERERGVAGPLADALDHDQEVRASKVGKKPAAKKAADRDRASDLTPFRERAKAMLERVEEDARIGGATPGSKIAAITVLAAHLKTLIEDLAAAGLRAEAMVLESLLGGIRSRLGDPSIQDAEAQDLFDRTVAVLASFAGVDRAQRRSGPKREGFWK